MTRLRILPGVTLHRGSKDGGPESRVYMYGLECKALASLLVLRFEDGSREAYHTHSFNAVSWVLGPGSLDENIRCCAPAYERCDIVDLAPSFAPVVTRRARCHKVISYGTTWVLSLRGPWASSWTDVDERTGVTTRLRAGRVPVAAVPG